MNRSALFHWSALIFLFFYCYQIPINAIAQQSINQPLRAAPLEVIVNQARVGQVVLLDRNSDFYATEETLQDWRITVPSHEKGIDFRGQKWFPLYSLPGYRARYDFTTQTLDLEFSPEAFAETRMKNDLQVRPSLTEKEPAVFLNYDISSTIIRNAVGPTSRSTGILSELGISYGAGVLTSSTVGRNLASSDPALPPEWKRLETTWTQDFLDSNSTLRLGDSSTRPGMWGRSAYFGGIQFGRNFGLTPGFVSQPIPSLAGTAAGPSTVELFINDALRQTTTVQSGPFVIENVPLVTGGGDARIVVKDVLGRETVITRSFFTSSKLLAKDLEDWSIEAGKLRLNLGNEDADYRDFFASGVYRRGVTQNFTVESRAEASSKIQNIGAGAVALMPWQLLGQTAIAASQTANVGSGVKMIAGIDRSSLRNGFSANIAHSNINYRQLGFGEFELPYKMELSASYRLTLDNNSSIGLSSARLESYNNLITGATTLSYSRRISRRGTLALSVTHTDGATSLTTYGMTLLIPLDGNQTTTANLTHKKGLTEWYAGMTAPVNVQTGLGWRAFSGSRAELEYLEGGIYFQGDKVYLSVDASNNRDTDTMRLNMQGAVVYIGAQLRLSRKLSDSFALVEVPGYANVGVGVGGNTLTKTDSDGIAILPLLMSYQINSIRLDPNDLPVSAELDNIEEQVVPAWRSGVRVVYPVRTGKAALIRIVLDDGDPAPAGSTVEIAGDKKEFFVARKGEAFITGLQPKNRVQLKWNNEVCSFSVDLPETNTEDIIRLGPYQCQGIKR